MAWWLHWFDLVDLAVYRAGANAFLHGRDVYSARPKVLPLPFTYPPFAAMAFVPLSVLPDIAARIVMSLLSGATVIYAVVATLRLAAPRWPRRAQWTVALLVAAATPLVEPFRDTFRLGQVNLVLMALVLADLVALAGTPTGSSVASVAGAPTGSSVASVAGAPEAGGPDAGAAPAADAAPDGAAPVAGAAPDVGARGGGRLPHGVLIGLATAVKLTPGIFILYLLVIRRTKEATTAALTAAGATALAWIAMPAESAHYWGHLVLDDRRIGSAGNVWNQSIRGALARASGSPDKAHLLWLLLALIALVAGLALAARLHAAGDPLLGIGVAAVTGLLVSPISWNHHWVWALPLGVGLWRRALVTRSGRAPADRWLAAGWTATFGLASLSWWHFATQDNYRLGGIDTIAADCYVLAAIAALGVVAWTIRRVPPAAK